MRSVTLGMFLCCVLLFSGVAPAQEAPAKKQSTKTQEHKTMKNAQPVALVETSMGSFEIELYPSDAPKTVENFVKLSEKKYFDGMRVHRIAKGFVIQTGDDKSKDPAQADQWGSGGQSIWGKEFEDELNPNAPSFKEGYKKGVVAMANRGPNTNTSQFFVCLQDVSLPHKYTIFGKVVKGMDVVDKIKQGDVIEKATVKQKRDHEYKPEVTTE